MFGAQPPFESHLTGLNEQARAMILGLRTFAKSLGPSVIEEGRPHRVVYAKTMTFRTFLDVAPAGDHLVVEIRSGRTEPPVRFEVRTHDDLEQVKKQAALAFEKIR